MTIGHLVTLAGILFTIGMLGVDARSCPLMRKVQADVRLAGSLESVARFLYALSRPGGFLSVAHTEIRLGEDGLVNVRVIAAGMTKRVAAPKQDLPTVHQKPAGYD